MCAVILIALEKDTRYYRTRKMWVSVCLTGRVDRVEMYRVKLSSKTITGLQYNMDIMMSPTLRVPRSPSRAAPLGPPARPNPAAGATPIRLGPRGLAARRRSRGAGRACGCGCCAMSAPLRVPRVLARSLSMCMNRSHFLNRCERRVGWRPCLWSLPQRRRKWLQLQALRARALAVAGSRRRKRHGMLRQGHS